MAIRRFKTRGLPQAYKKANLSIKRENKYGDENVVIQYAQSIAEHSDISMQVIFPHEVLLSIFKKISTNTTFFIRFELINKLQNKPPFVKDFIQQINSLISKNTLQDKDGFIEYSLHQKIIDIFDSLIQSNHVKLHQLVELYRENYIQKEILGVKNSTSDIIGRVVLIPIQKSFEKLYANKTLTLKGKDANVTNDIGLLSEEQYRLYIKCGKRYQKIIPTFDVANSDNNPGQFESLRVHVISSVSLEKPIDKI